MKWTSLILLSMAPALALCDELKDSDFTPIVFVKINPGTFNMGKSDIWEKPHTVQLTHTIEMQEFTVTQYQWYKVRTDLPLDSRFPSYFKDQKFCSNTYLKIEGGAMCANHPVDGVNWRDAVDFANQYSRLNGLDPCYSKDENKKYGSVVDIYSCKGYRLPTEAEWEYAARAGSEKTFLYGDDPRGLERYAVFAENSPRVGDSLSPAEVGSLEPNRWGLYDMLGNIWQWIHDRYPRESLPEGPIVNPPGARGGDSHGVRGGAYDRTPYYLGLGEGFSQPEGGGIITTGFRLVRTLK